MAHDNARGVKEMQMEIGPFRKILITGGSDRKSTLTTAPAEDEITNTFKSINTFEREDNWWKWGFFNLMLYMSCKT